MCVLGLNTTLHQTIIFFLQKYYQKVSVYRNFFLILHRHTNMITMELQKKFNVILHREAQEFLASLDEKTRNKIFQTFDRASLLLDPEVFKKLADTDIWEFRTLFNKRKYRVLAFWDKEGPVDTLVIATHGFVKKTQKTPQKEVNKAISIRELYFKNKQNNKKDE